MGSGEESVETSSNWVDVSKIPSIGIDSYSTHDLRVALTQSGELNEGEGLDTAIEVSSSEGAVFYIPVRVEPIDLSESRSNGLWVGRVIVDKVNFVSDSDVTQSKVPKPVQHPFEFRIILHWNEEGEQRVVRLLKQAFEMWDSSKKQKIVVTEQDDAEKLVSEKRATPLRRIDSVVFSNREPILFNAAGIFGEELYSLSGEMNVEYDDDRNPFVHRYHPDHNNLDERYENVLPAGDESYSINREFKLKFTASPVNGALAPPGWGINTLGGHYEETITGAHKKSLVTSGIFLISKVSDAIYVSSE